jgi:hypothetical protein
MDSQTFGAMPTASSTNRSAGLYSSLPVQPASHGAAQSKPLRSVLGNGNNKQPMDQSASTRDDESQDEDWLKSARYSGCRNDRAKPPYSYASLIAQAIMASPTGRLTLTEIYTWIMRTFPYYQSQNSGWQNSIRHNLSLNRCFVKESNSSLASSTAAGPHKGSYWSIEPALLGELNDSGLFKRRKHRTEKRAYLQANPKGPYGAITRGPHGARAPLRELQQSQSMAATRKSSSLSIYRQQPPLLAGGMIQAIFADLPSTPLPVVVDRSRPNETDENYLVSQLDWDALLAQEMRGTQPILPQDPFLVLEASATLLMCPELTDSLPLRGHVVITSSEFY